MDLVFLVSQSDFVIITINSRVFILNISLINKVKKKKKQFQESNR